MNDYFTYANEATRYTKFPLGGIGAGSIGLGADGRLQDWEIYNRPSKGSVNGFSHFAIRAERDAKTIDTRVLNGPFMGNRSGEMNGQPFHDLGFGPRREYMTGFPSFETSSLSGPYPIAKLMFEDKRFPAGVRMTALSPFIPMDDRLSSMPVAMFEFDVSNPSDDPLDITIFGCLAFLFEGARVELTHSDGVHFLSGSSAERAESLEYKDLCISTDCDDISYQRNLFHGNWFDMMEIYWQDISQPGKLTDRYYEPGAPKGLVHHRTPQGEHGVLAAHCRLDGNARRTIRFAITWNVPNAYKYWESRFNLAETNAVPPAEIWQNYYASQWDTSRDSAREIFARWDEAKGLTQSLKDILVGSTMPNEVIDAVSANLSILKTTTVLRLQDGTFYGWEGCGTVEGCCEGSCTHVWNYQQVLPFLFPALERSMREADFKHNQFAETGGMTFRLSLPLGVGIGSSRPCVDGQFGNVIKAYRDWKLSGDTDWLRSIWPNVKAAIDYAWHPGNYDKWDPDRTGVLTGRQHHTLDMELFGPNSWLTGFYLAALKSGAEMAEGLGETNVAAEYLRIFEAGRVWVRENLFNGRYFIQDVNLEDAAILDGYDTDQGSTGYSDGSTRDLYWSDEQGELKYQIGEGCEIDQVLAEWFARLYGTGPIFDPAQFRSAVLAIYENNFNPQLGDLPNPCRVYGMQEESGTVMCQWPKTARRPRIPVPYSQETMHGFEYAFGGQLMMVGEFEKGFEVFRGVRDRYRGHNRNPWNEIECGSHYARSMASYASVPILSGLEFDGINSELRFKPALQRDGRFSSLWSNGQAWGHIEISDGEARISVLGGTLRLAKLGIGTAEFSCADLVEFGAETTDSQIAQLVKGGALLIKRNDIKLDNAKKI